MIDLNGEEEKKKRIAQQIVESKRTHEESHYNGFFFFFFKQKAQDKNRYALRRVFGRFRIKVKGKPPLSTVISSHPAKANKKSIMEARLREELGETEALTKQSKKKKTRKKPINCIKG